MIVRPSPDKAQAFLERNTIANLAVLGALLFEPIEAIYGLEHAGELAALGLIVAEEANVPDSLPTVMLSTQNTELLVALLAGMEHPPHATWVASTRTDCELLEACLKREHDADQGVLYFGAQKGQTYASDPARPLTSADTSLDLTPCSLSAMALSYWMIRGWHVFGIVENQRLLGHAVAAYPIAHTEEVSAVFTAPQARRQGIASACAAAAINDIQARGKQAVYVSRKANTASIGVAQGLGMQQLLETWEIVT